MREFKALSYHFFSFSFDKLISCFSLVVLLFLLCVPVLYAEGPAPETSLGFNETATLIAEIPENSAVIGDSIQPMPDKGKMAYVVETKEGFKVCMNNDCSPLVGRVARGMLAVSPNGNHLAAVAQARGENEKARVMLNGNMGKAFDMVHDLRFSPDSMKLAYIVQADDAFFVYVNQDRHPSFAVIDPSLGLIFSRDSSHLAYVASDDGQSWRLVHNGEPGEAFEEIKHVTFSPDSSRLAYAAKTDGKWHIVKDGDKGPGYAGIKRIRFSPDAESRLAYVARDDDGAFVVLDGEKSKVYDYVPGEPVFSNDGKRLAYAVAEERRFRGIRMRMVVDGKAGPAFDQIGAYRFSPDGGQFAYMAVVDKDKEKARMVHNGEAHDIYQSIGMPVFSPDGRHLAYYLFDDGLWQVRKNGEKGPRVGAAHNPVFSPDGERMAYLARIGDHWMVIEDGEMLGNPYAWADMLTFSPDGRHLACAAAGYEDEGFFLAINGEEGKERFMSFLRGSRLVFTDDDTVHGIAVRDEGRSFWHIRAEIEK